MELVAESVKQELYFSTEIDQTIVIGHTYVTGKLMIITCTSGEARLVVGKEELTLDRYHFFFLHPHAEVTALSTSSDFKGYVIGFSLGIQESEFAQLDPNFFAQMLKTPRWRLTSKQEEAMEGFCKSFHYIYTQVGDEFKTDIISSYFTVFLRTFYANTQHLYTRSGETSNASSRTLTVRFLSLLQKHYRQQHRVAFYAQQLCVSPKYLTQTVKATCQITPKVLIDHKLSIESLYKLGRTTSTIQEISFYLGFPDQSYFGRFFKRIFGISPLSYRLNPNLDLMQKLEMPGNREFPSNETATETLDDDV